MAKMGAPVRHRHLDRDDVGQSSPERPWWPPRRPWPPGMRFEDVSAAERAFERLADRAMPPRPIPASVYGSSAWQCITSRFAEPEVELG